MLIYKKRFTLLSETNKAITCLEQLPNEWLVSGGILNELIQIWDLIERVCVRVIYLSNPIDSYDKALSKSYSSSIRAVKLTCLKAFERKMNEELFEEYESSFVAPDRVLCLELISTDQLLCSCRFTNNRPYVGQLLINLTTFEQTDLGLKTYSSTEEEKYGHRVFEQLRKFSGKNGREFIEFFTLKTF